MHTKTVVKTNTEKLRFGFWDEKNDTFVTLDDCDKKEALSYLGINPNMLDALNMFAGEIVDLVGTDLKSIWERIDKLEARQ